MSDKIEVSKADWEEALRLLRETRGALIAVGDHGTLERVDAFLASRTGGG